MAKLYNRRVQPWQVKVDDLVLRRAEISDSTHTREKLALNWEGPYRVTNIIRDETYRLTTQEGNQLLRT
ncbi:hypothetical protein B296_00045079 [Ensete ventricosum]|uniref:Integrase zinc-binding domain-containing protein n=1 Tax=Ensete ventricosum TaxID=4639 RepID=A0A426Z8K4_ENSVE|nr:hypothetical protein B296_00045079 [Ensete ventricosum]